jgi:hypothetical protein
VRILRAAALLAGALVSGCMTIPPPISNPTGLSAEALTLAYVLDRGCLPYLLGEKTEDQAMRPLRLSHVYPLELPFDPSPPSGPHWVGPYPGGPFVGVYGPDCTIIATGGDVADYRTVIQRVLDRRLGPASRSDFANFAGLPGRLTGCRMGLHYAYFQERRWFGSSFHLELNHNGCSP